MAWRPNLDISRHRLEEYRTHTSHSTAKATTWQQFRSGYRDLPLRMDSPLRMGKSPSLPLYRLGFNRSPPPTKRTQSPLQKYRSNPDLFYQTLGTPSKSPSPPLTNFSRTLSSGLMKSRLESTAYETSSVLKRRLNDVLHLEDLIKVQEVASEMTADDLSKLPQRYVEELRKTVDLLDRKLRRT